MRRDIDTKMLEVQVRVLEDEIKECLNTIETSESFPDDVYERYQALKKEKQALLDSYVPAD